MLASCSGGSDGSTGATVPQATATTDPYAVPATITIDYLNRVFEALEKINGDATRLIVAHGRITPEAAKLLDAIYTAEEFEIQADIWSQEVAKGLHNFRTNPGDRIVTVRRVAVSRRDCVALQVARDYSAISKEPRSPSEGEISLVREAPSQLNPTPWAISKDIRSGALPCV